MFVFILLLFNQKRNYYHDLLNIPFLIKIQLSIIVFFHYIIENEQKWKWKMSLYILFNFYL